MRFFIGRNTDAQSRHCRDHFFAQPVCGFFSHWNNHRQRHAAFASRTESSAGQIIHNLVEIRVRQNDTVVFRATHRLDPFAGCNAALIDIMGDIGGTDKADPANGRMIKNGINHFLVTLQTLQDTRWQASFVHQFDEPNGNRRITLGRLTHGVNIDARPCALRIFALEDMWNTATEFDHFQPALDVALGVGNHLAMFDRQKIGQLVHMRFDQFLELEHHPCASLRVGCCPCRLRRQRRVYGLVEHRCITEIHLALDAAVIRVENIALAGRCCVSSGGQDMGYCAH